LSNDDPAIWIALIAGQVILCLCINVMIHDLGILQGLISLRIRAVSRYLRRGDARENEGLVSRDFDGCSGSGIPNDNSGRYSRTSLSTQPGLSDRPAKNSNLSAGQKLLVTTEHCEQRVTGKKGGSVAL
jgi:hypothetical protein